MSAMSLLAREEWRRRAGALVAVAALLALGLGATLIAFETAQRTDEAYPDFLDRAEVSELVVNPVLPTERVRAMLRSIPGVRSLSSDSLLLAAVAHPGDPDLPTNQPFLQVRTSSDGRYSRQDRPIVTRGRMIRSGNEVFLSREAADALGFDVGDDVDVVFASSRSDVGIDSTTSIEEIGRPHAVVVGIGVFPDEVLPNELLPRQKALVSHDLAAPYDCTFHIEPGLQGNDLAELVPQIIPERCSVSYRYYSAHLDGGDRAAPRVVDELTRRFEAANAELPTAMREADVAYQVIPSFRSADRDRVAEALLPATTSLRVFGAATGLVTVVLALLLSARAYRRRGGDQVVWAALGMPRRARALSLFLPVAAALVAGVIVAIIGAWFTSPIGPIASGRTVVPHPERALGSDAWLATLVVALVATAGALAVAHGSASLRPDGTSGSSRRARPFRTRRPAVGLGLGAAWRSRGSTALVAGAVLAVVAITAAVVFSVGLGQLLDQPQRFGWPFDAGVVVNAGYGPTDLEAVGTALDRPEVDRWEAASITSGASVDGVSVPMISPRTGTDGMFGQLPTTAGRLPGRREVALGAATARRLDVAVGDEVEVAMSYGRAAARVSGIVVLPALGPLESDRMAPGVGVLIGTELFESILDQARTDTGLSGGELADQQTGFVAIDLASGVDATTFFRSIDADQRSWGADPTQVHDLPMPVRPPSIVDVSSMRRLPAALAAVVALGVALAVVVGIVSLTRSRRRELSILRAIGAGPRMLRGTVVVESVAVVAAGLVLGLPLGVLAGNVGYDAFARSLGVATTTVVPVLALVAIGIATLGIGLAAGFWPRRPASDGVERTQVDLTLTRRGLAE